ncbi:MAG: cytochrome c maturation protein CcmE [Actinobacteria bacterium]|nr:MAG: cytochrome c maturation protein CcmE [Actinomycetota bacterium]
MDLTPRPKSQAPKRRRWIPIIILSLVGVGGVVIVTQFLSSAIDYYCNVDEVGVRSGCDTANRLRVQGTVEQGSLAKTDNSTKFRLVFNGKSLDVTYSGDPGGVFQECVSVVAHGRLVNGKLESNRIEVKHSNEYEAKNKDRLEKSGSAACSQVQG